MDLERGHVEGEPGTGSMGSDTAQLLAGDHLPDLRELERRYIRMVLDRAGGNKRRAAALLGVSRRTLYRRLDEEPPDPVAGGGTGER